MKKEWIAWLGIGAGLAILAAVLFGRLWGGHFILHTIDYVVESLATRSGWSPDLVRGLVILITIPFFWAVAKYSYGLFVPYPSFRLFRSRYGMIIVAYAGFFFLARYAASRDALADKWCDITQEGIRVFDGPGNDTVYGLPLHPCTMEERVALRQQRSDFQKPPTVRTGDPHFDTATGQPLQNYYKHGTGLIELFPIYVIHHPRYGDLLHPITPEIAREYEQQQQRNGSPQAGGQVRSADEGCGLGYEWDEREVGFIGTWTRRGTSNTFDAHWSKGAFADNAVLNVDITGNRVSIKRTQPDGRTCQYTGTLQNNHVTGSYRCSWDSFDLQWDALIKCRQQLAGGPP